VSSAAGRGARLLADVTHRMEQVLGSVTRLVAAAESIAGEAGRPPGRKAPGSKPPGRKAPGSQPQCRKAPFSKPPYGKQLRRDDFAALRPLVAGLLREHAGLAAGAGVVLAPQTLADAPRCIEWWWADRSARVVPLEVDLDPESAEFYDYTTTEWYREPERTGAPTLAGPYVDFICTHEYTFTLAAPVRHGGRFIGVAAADILATQVERLVLPGLCGLGLSGPGQAAVLTSGHGRVIASTSASLPPGAALPRPPQEAGVTPLAGCGAGQPPGLLPWSLLTVRTA
jgi:hypothetical protein